MFYRAFRSQRERFLLGGGRECGVGGLEGDAHTDRAVDSVNLGSRGSAGSLAFLCPVK